MGRGQVGSAGRFSVSVKRTPNCADAESLNQALTRGQRGEDGPAGREAASGSADPAGAVVPAASRALRAARLLCALSSPGDAAPGSGATHCAHFADQN